MFVHTGDEWETACTQLNGIKFTLHTIDDDFDRVIYLLASLPESFGVLVTALEASAIRHLLGANDNGANSKWKRKLQLL